MATLIVSPFTPAEGTGRSLRTIGVARALARGEDVEIAYVAFEGGRVAPALLDEPRLSLRALTPTRGVRRGIAYLRARAAGTPRAFARGVSSELARAARGAIFDRVIADGPSSAAALLLVERRRGVVYCAHNLESSFRSSLPGARRDYGTSMALRRFERTIMTRADEVWVPTHRDATEVASFASSACVRYVPNVIDVVAIHPASSPASRRILFVADFTYEPNREAARFLVGDVMPRVWGNMPDARLALVGRSRETLPAGDRRVEVAGFVEDLAPEYAKCACAVVPLLTGGGSPLKFVEALAYGLPVVATPSAASGLEALTPGVDYLPGSDGETFAGALCDVLGGRAEGVGARGRTLVEEHYSIEALAHMLGGVDAEAA